MKRKGSKVRIELKESEKMGIERENERERLGEKNLMNLKKKMIKEKRECLCVCVSPSRSSAVGQYFASALLYN